MKLERIDFLNLYSGPDRLTRILLTHHFRKDNLMEIVKGYSEDCFIGKFQFGEVYRGTYDGKEVIVKVWKDDLDAVRPGDNESRFYDELKLQEYFARHSFHPNMAKVIGYCNSGKQLALVYHLKPKAIDTLRNLIEKDNFTWTQRIKAALGFASLLEFMHSKSESPTRLPYLIRNIDPANIMVDEDYEPVLFDLSMVSGGILTDKRHLVDQYSHGCNNYVDPICAHPGKWSAKSDVYSFGVLLLELITKGECMRPIPNSQSRHSLVHSSLNLDSNFRLSDAIKITKLATDCAKYDPLKRPTMKQVVRCLQNLHVVRHHANTWDINKMLDGDDAILRCVKHHGKKPEKRLKFTQAQFLKFLSINPLSRAYSRDPNHGVSGNMSLRGKDNAVRVFSYEDLSIFTNNFNKENLIGNVQYGEAFRCKIGEKNVMVKIWKPCPPLYPVRHGDNESRFRDEMALLQHPNLMSHPNMVKLMGYCYEEEKIGVVYDLEPHDTVYNLVLKDDFTWLRRVRTIYEFACLLKFLHDPNLHNEPYIIRNLDAAHIILDKEYIPKLFDFGMCSGGILLDVRQIGDKFKLGTYGYRDPYSSPRGGVWLTVSDVYAYGYIMLSLISKRLTTIEGLMNDEPLVSEWAFEECEKQMRKGGSCSLVDVSLKTHDGFNHNDGVQLTKLGLECISSEWFRRPTMKQVVKRLLNLRVLRTHDQELGIKQKQLKKHYCISQ